MTTVKRSLPERPHLEVPRREARELLNHWRNGERDAIDRIRRRHPRFEDAEDSTITAGPFRLADAQFVISREYGFAHWSELKQRIAASLAVAALGNAIGTGDRDAAIRLIQTQPELLHLPIWSGDWGPPMSHAANLGRLEIVKAVAALGARDFQHALDRAVLQGRIECARWLHENGANATPGLIMGACETQNAAGVRFLAEVNAPFTDASGNPLPPLAMTLETYGRNPEGKHQILKILAERGYAMPDTSIMALHRGDIARLEKHLERDPRLLDHRFTLVEIYPPECGCAPNGRSGMHWTPIDGGTLLHIAIDFRETGIFQWLLDRGADVNARAAIDRDGFGGHTPLFNSMVCGPWPDQGMTRALLEKGATKDTRATLRKFLDWTEEPRWHEAHGVTAVEWGRGFPEKRWVNAEALGLLR